jgi:uncharacterized membrane-anchored protein
MTTPPQLERKVRQLDNDVAAVYEILARIELKQGRHDNRFDEMGADLDALKTDLAGVQADVGGLRTDVSGLTADVGALKADVAGVKAGVAVVTGQLGEVLEILRAR